MNNPKHTQAWEQFGAAAREMASVLGQYRDELGRQGFTRQEALSLVAHMQVQLMSKMSGGDAKSDGERWKNG